MRQSQREELSWCDSDEKTAAQYTLVPVVKMWRRESGTMNLSGALRKCILSREIAFVLNFGFVPFGCIKVSLRGKTFQNSARASWQVANHGPQTDFATILTAIHSRNQITIKFSEWKVCNL